MATTDAAAALAAAEAAKARTFERSMKSMKKAVLEVQLILLDGVDTDEQLHAAGRILAQSEYSDVVEERYIAKVCGYARCANALSIEDTRKGRYRISLSAKKVYDLEESRHFCSPSCLIASKEFGTKLLLRQDVVESTESLMETLASVRGSQYAARTRPVRLKEDSVLKLPARPKNAKRGKVRLKETKNAPSGSSELARSLVEDRGQLDTRVLSPQLSTVPAESFLENENHESVSCSSRIEPSNCRDINPNPSFTFQSTPVISSTLGSDGKAAGTVSKSSLDGQKLQASLTSTSTHISSTVQRKFEELMIQERVGDQTVLPMLDYGGPSDAIEGYVPSRSRRDALSQAEPRTQAKVSKSSNSSDVQGKPLNLKPALKKLSIAKQSVRSVAWADQNTSKVTSHIAKTKSKERASSTNADETLIFEKTADDGSRVEEKIKCMKLEGEERPEARLSESSLALATRLASAEAIATVLTEAATSAAAGELDGSEAVAQAGISILSGSHNATTTTSVSPDKAQVQSGAFDEDELFARAAQSREEMRRLKMPRKYSELQDENGGYGDLIDDFNPVADEDDGDSHNDDAAADDAGVDDDDDDDYDDSGGFEGAHEVGFTAPPKGFKAEVSMFGTMFMALEGWISAAAVAHIYGKEPYEEDEYLSVNGREYSRQAVIGDGVSAEILRTFSLCISRALPEVVRVLRVSVPLSTLELSLGRLIKTMSFVEALPPFGTKKWRILAILLLDALSIQRVPRLGVHFSNNRSMMRKVLDSTGTGEAEYNVFRDVVLPLGRSPTFSTLSGG